MRRAEMDRWAAHCSRCFHADDEKDCIVFHPRNHRKLHIDMLLFPPNKAYPFYKLCTMGASDYKLPLTLCHRNEFVMFLSEQEALSQQQTLEFFCDVLLTVALYPAENHFTLNFGHSIVWGKQAGTDMEAAFLDLPYPIQDPGFAKCRLSPVKETRCLQVTLLTREETEQMRTLGPEKFYDFLYPSQGKAHFLSQRFRDSLF